MKTKITSILTLLIILTISSVVVIANDTSQTLLLNQESEETITSQKIALGKIMPGGLTTECVANNIILNCGNHEIGHTCFIDTNKSLVNCAGRFLNATEKDIEAHLRTIDYTYNNPSIVYACNYYRLKFDQSSESFLLNGQEICKQKVVTTDTTIKLNNTTTAQQKKNTSDSYEITVENKESILSSISLPISNHLVTGLIFPLLLATLATILVNLFLPYSKARKRKIRFRYFLFWITVAISSYILLMLQLIFLK